MMGRDGQLARETQALGSLGILFQTRKIPGIREGSVQGFDTSRPGGDQQAGPAVEDLVSRKCPGTAQVGCQVLGPQGQGRHPGGGRGGLQGLFHPHGRFNQGYDPRDTGGKALLLLNFKEQGVQGPDILLPFRLGQEHRLTARGKHGQKVVPDPAGLHVIDPDNPFSFAEIQPEKGRGHQVPGCILVPGQDRVLQVENQGIRVQYHAVLDHVGLVAGNKKQGPSHAGSPSSRAAARRKAVSSRARMVQSRAP